MIFTRLFSLLGVALTLFAGSIISLSEVSAADPAPATRVVFGISSAEVVLSELEYLVVTLGGKKSSWENNVQPNIDYFLIGVARDQPIRFDQIIDVEHGQQTESIIPIDSLRDFLSENLEPIGIDSERTRSDRDLYQLTGKLFQGWLRYLPEPFPYAIIFAQKEAIPKGMAEPQKIQDPLIANGETAFISLRNSSDGADQRQQAFDKYRNAALEKFQKLPTESKEEFELRKRMRAQSLAVMEQWFVEAAQVNFSYQMLAKESRMPGKLSFAALPDTALAKNIAHIKSDPSHFAAIASPEDAVLAMRVNLPVDPARIPGYQEIYEMARPVMKEKIEQDQTAGADEKKAREAMSGLLLDVFSESADLGVVDLFVDVFPANGAHTIALGVRCSAKEKLLQAIEHLPNANQGWTLKKDVDQVGDVSIHHLNLGKALPKSLASFYGTSGDVFLAVTDDAFWLSGGEASLEALKSRIQTASEGAAKEGDGVMLSLKMHAAPVLQNLNDFFNEVELGVVESIDIGGRVQNRAQQGSQSNPDRPGARATSNLGNFEWEETAIQNMQGEDDLIEMRIAWEKEGQLTGSSDAHKGVLKAIGALIAKFADENLQ